MDSVKSPVRSNIEPQEPLYLGTEQVPVHEEKDGLERFGGRKFIIGMTLILVASIFTGIGIMTIDQWLMFTGVVGASYFGINFIQKKAL